MILSTTHTRLVTFLFFGLSLVASEALAQRGSAKHIKSKSRAMPSKKAVARPSASHSPSMHRPSSNKSIPKVKQELPVLVFSRGKGSILVQRLL